MSGAQVVPIFAYSNQSVIAAQLPKLNGVLFPGGDLDFDLKNRWTSNANFIFQWAMQENDKGKVFPIWGTCMGHQLFGYLTCNGETPLSPVRGEQSIINTIKFITGDKGYVFEGMSDKLITKLTTGQGVTYYNHEEAILMSTYNTTKKLSDFWKVIAETTSSYNEKFVAVWEARRYPFYSIQFHPEKSVFEWKIFSDKSYDSVEVSQWMSNKFIDKARQSLNQYTSQDDFEKANIQNYKTYTSVMRFTRIYLFNETKPIEETVQENFSL